MKTERQKQHTSYLASQEWAKIRCDLFNIRGEKCEVCGSNNRLQVHHLNYDNWMNEEPGDLIILCSHCHLFEHGLVKKKRKSRKKWPKRKKNGRKVSRKMLQKRYDKQQKKKKMPIAEILRRSNAMDVKAC